MGFIREGGGDHFELFLGLVEIVVFCHTKSPYIFVLTKNTVCPPLHRGQRFGLLPQKCQNYGFLFLLYMAIVCKFWLHWLASYEQMSKWSPHMPLL